MKTIQTFSIDTKVMENARKTNVNLSKVVERALFEVSGVIFSKEFETLPRNMLRKAVKHVNNCPGGEEFWAEWLNKRCNTTITPEQLKKYAQFH